jgi:hypothetical protein
MRVYLVPFLLAALTILMQAAGCRPLAAQSPLASLQSHLGPGRLPGTSGNAGIIGQVPATKNASAYDVFLQSGLNCLADGYFVQSPPVWQSGPKVFVALGTLTDSKGVQHGIVGTIAGVLIDIPIPTTPNTSANPVNMTTFTP